MNAIIMSTSYFTNNQDITFMMYLVLDVLSTEHSDTARQLHAWVNVSTQSEAMTILGDELAQNGWSMANVVEVTTTTKDDYFAPCKSLDAFNEASQGLYTIRFF